MYRVIYPTLRLYNITHNSTDGGSSVLVAESSWTVETGNSWYRGQGTTVCPARSKYLSWGIFMQVYSVHKLSYRNGTMLVMYSKTVKPTDSIPIPHNVKLILTRYSSSRITPSDQTSTFREEETKIMKIRMHQCEWSTQTDTLGEREGEDLTIVSGAKWRGDLHT